MKLSKTAWTKLKNSLKRGTLITEVSEDGTAMFYEDESHKTKLETRKAEKQAKLEAKRQELKNGRNG